MSISVVDLDVDIASRASRDWGGDEGGGFVWGRFLIMAGTIMQRERGGRHQRKKFSYPPL